MHAAPRRLLLDCYAAALTAVDGRTAVRERLMCRADTTPLYALAIGKAAPAMMQGAVEALGERLTAGLVITKQGYAAGGGGAARISVLEAEHPLPGPASLAAGRALLDFIAALPPQAPVLSLLSGGASALVEVLPSGIGLTQLQAANDWLLASGWDIGRINPVRRAISCLKGGRLAGQLTGHPVLNLLLSDVSGDDPAVIGSGLLVPSPDGLAAADRARLPPWLRDLLAAAPPLPSPAVFATIQTEVLRRNRDARAAAAAAARRRGLTVHLSDEPVQGEAAPCGRALARQLLAGPAGLYVWGGETTVTLPPHPGRGGRCQQLALAAAQVLAGRNDVFLLAAGTDGSDGPGEDAGALVDGGSVARGELDGLDAHDSLMGADAGRFLEASGDLIQTGPTGSNVMDLVLAFKPA